MRRAGKDMPSSKPSLHRWFSRNNGKGWINCKKSRKGKGGAGGRKKAGCGGSYPGCRPTLAQCNGAGKKKHSSKRISWKKGKK